MPQQREDSPSALWRNERRRFLEDGTEAHRLLKRLNGEGSHLLALEVAESILAEKSFDDAVPVQQQMARALAILGSSDAALEVLRGIAPGRADEAETLGLLARVWKDLAGAAEDKEEAERCFRESFQNYAKGFDVAVAGGDAGGAAYCGINAAAVAVWLGEIDSATDFAAKAAGHAEGDASYYGIATRAEAALILGNDSDAANHYRQASEMGEAGKRWADIASTRQQCRALCLKLHGRRDHMDASFSLGSVAVVSSKAPEESTDQMVGVVRDRVAAWLQENGVRHVFCGDSDAWDIIPDGLAIEVLRIPQEGTGEGARRFMARMIAARGALLASHLGVPLKALTIGDKQAVTAAPDWQKAGLAPYAIFPGKSHPDGVPDPDAPADPVPFPRTLASGVEKEQVLALLHLHFAGGKAPGKVVLDLLAARIAASDNPPSYTQGHGGDYVFAFHSLRHAAVVALAFMEALEQGEPCHPSICLHAGLVEMDVNPLLHLYAPDGKTVSLCGEIAAALPPGTLSATETFTALCALESVRGFRFAHSGMIETAGGTTRLFNVHPTAKP